MTQIDPKYVAIGHYMELLSVLQAENRTFIRGQHIWAIDDVSGTNKKGLKLGMWDPDGGDEASAPKFNDLPWEIKPEASGSGGFTPFAVFTSSLSEPKYEPVGSDVVITDLRLKGSNTPLISSTARGVDFRRNEFNHDPVAGTITLLNFPGMEADDHISIYLPSAVVTSDDLGALATRLARLEWLAAPFLLGGGIHLFKKPANQIPPGWLEVSMARAKFLIGWDPDNPLFDEVWTDTGGSIDHTLTEDELPEITPELGGGFEQLGGGSSGVRNAPTFFDFATGVRAPGQLIKPFGGGQAHSILNPYRVVVFIEPDLTYVIPI